MEYIQVISLLHAASKLDDNNCLITPVQEELPAETGYVGNNPLPPSTPATPEKPVVPKKPSRFKDLGAKIIQLITRDDADDDLISKDNNN
jgi:hypothetical protein